MADFRIGDYDYTIIDADNNYVQVRPYDRTKSSYETLSSKVEYEGEEFIVTDMSNCFNGCASFNQSIVIPNSVTNISLCFYNCPVFNSLVTFEEDSQVTNMNYCFGYCTSFDKPITIPDSVTDMGNCFSWCTSFNQPIVIPNSVTKMGHCFDGCTSFNNYILCFNKPVSYADIFREITKDTNVIAIGDDNYSTWQTIKNGSGNNIDIPNNFEFEYGDYKYTGVDSGSQNYIRVQVIDKTKTEYGEILSTYINNRKVTDMYRCFYGCTSLVTAPDIPNGVTSIMQCFVSCASLVNAPVIPNSVTGMRSCFEGCTSLVNAPVIPNSVTDMNNCFYRCTSLRGDVYIYAGSFSSYYQCFHNTSHTICLHAMNNNIEECDALAGTANNNNVYVNVKPEIALNFNNTQVNYLNQNSEFVALSMQTNANLIQCRVPKLSGSGASVITTNLNDALIDLYRRKVGGV